MLFSLDLVKWKLLLNGVIVFICVLTVSSCSRERISRCGLLTCVHSKQWKWCDSGGGGWLMVRAVQEKCKLKNLLVNYCVVFVWSVSVGGLFELLLEDR